MRKYVLWLIATPFLCFGAMFMYYFIGFTTGLIEPEPTATVTPTLTASPTISPTVTPVPSETPIPTNTPAPTNTPPPTATPEPLAALDAAITDALGESNRDIDDRVRVDLTGGILDVRWSVNEALLVSGYRLRVETDAVDILQAVAASGIEYDQLMITAEDELIDVLGNASEDTVAQALYSKSVIDQINFDNFLRRNVFVIADSRTINPSLQD